MILSNARIVCPNKVIEKGMIDIDNGRIRAVKSTSEIRGIDLNGLTVFPGFIDMHIHGSNNIDFMDLDKDLNTILTNTLKEGTTSLLATTMTQDPSRIEKSLKRISDTISKGTKLLGIHLEGPFLNEKYSGAQNEELIIEGKEELFNKLYLASNQMIKVVTLAPEKQSPKFLKYLDDLGIILSMGHSEATVNDVIEAMSYNCQRITHGYNAMSKLHHREIGLVGSMFLFDTLDAEIIPDLHHTSKEALQLLYKVKTDKHIQLVTDSIRAKNMEDGVYELGGADVTVRDGFAYIGDTIAGSTLTMNQGLKNMYESTGCSLIELANMASTNQAKELKLDHELGKVQEGYVADLAILDENFNVVLTLVDGEILYKRG